MPIRTSCACCGEETNNSKYCSRKCYGLVQRKGKDVSCYGCGETFYLKPHQVSNEYYYCSRECKSENPPTLTRLVCQECGEYFIVPRAQSKKRKFCNKQCAGKSFRRHEIDICPICGEEFDQPRGRPKKYCTKKCAGVAKRKTKVCTVCGEEFWNRNSKAKYCSPKCKNKNTRVAKSKCGWCGGETKKATAKFCSQSCRKMHDHYGNVNLRTLMDTPLEAFISEGEKAVWLPLTATEIEITLYLHYKGCRISEIRRHIRRWRKARKEKKHGVSNG